MGYTHYFTNKQQLDSERFAAFIKDAALLIVGKNDIIAGPLGEDNAICTHDSIAINGIGDDSHEDFTLNVNEGFKCCKTALKPYDEIVTAILLLFDDHFGDQIQIGTDGEADEWIIGAAFYSKTFRKRSRLYKRYWLQSTLTE